MGVLESGVKQVIGAWLLGILSVAFAIVLRQFTTSSFSSFFQGFATGLGLCLIVASHFWNRKKSLWQLMKIRLLP